VDFLTQGGGTGETHPEYCRSVEAYLCRRNDGHLIRIVGPAFEQVCGWADRGVPLKVVYRGIDRYFERYYAKGPRRRPVRIEFCEADVLDVFDEWRRAVGVLVARDRRESDESEDAYGEISERTPTRRSLSAHLERVIARLIALSAEQPTPVHEHVLRHVLEAVARLRGEGRVLRGEARQAAIEQLAALDTALMAAARSHMDASMLGDTEVEAAQELEPFRARMTADTYATAVAAATARLIRERTRLPVLIFD
jgi:hypothetical protein